MAPNFIHEGGTMFKHDMPPNLFTHLQCYHHIMLLRGNVVLSLSFVLFIIKLVCTNYKILSCYVCFGRSK